MKFIYDNGGRSAAGYKGNARDCVCRAIAIASGRPYTEVYAALSEGRGAQRASSRTGAKSASARNTINTKRKWFKDYMHSLGFTWTPTMTIGSGCKVHLHEGELPAGRLVVAVSKHYTAVVDGDIRDIFDPRREAELIVPDQGQELKPGQWRNSNGICSVQRRCVYGYWTFSGAIA